jgi:Ankyrin repeats (3 copies)
MTMLLSSPPRHQQKQAQGQHHHHQQQQQHQQQNAQNSNKLPPQALMKTVGIFGTSYSLVLRVLESDPATQARYVSRDDCSVLHMLCRYPDVPDHVVQALMDAYPEALVLRGGLFQSTPLAVACERGVSNSVISLLVQANPETLAMTDGRGLTPVQIAEQHGHGRIVELLQQLSSHRPR